jgi:hypothetical protein
MWVCNVANSVLVAVEKETLLPQCWFAPGKNQDLWYVLLRAEGVQGAEIHTHYVLSMETTLFLRVVYVSR